ncbi:MAG: proline dehydrogenase family protein [Gemmatimonadaceae bacterium]
MRQPFARRAVKRFMPGEELHDALTAAGELKRIGIGTLVTRLGESLTGESQADAVRDHYLAAFDEIRAQGIGTRISVKPTQLGLDHSFDACLRHMDTLAAKAAETGNELWIDMEDSSYVDRTLDLYRRVKSRYSPVGIAIQAYLKRTPADVESLMPVKPIIRLVKGAYAEPPHVAFPQKRDVDLAYVAISERLLEAATRGEAMPVFGTHDVAILRQLNTRADALKLPATAYEIHMLFGIRSSEQRQLVAEGRTVKCLISYGAQWFPWYMRRAGRTPGQRGLCGTQHVHELGLRGRRPRTARGDPRAMIHLVTTTHDPGSDDTLGVGGGGGVGGVRTGWSVDWRARAATQGRRRARGSRTVSTNLHVLGVCRRRVRGPDPSRPLWPERRRR